MTPAAELARWQRRIRPEKRRTPLGYRDRSALPFFPAASLSGPVMLDTCAYIDALSGRMPLALQALLPGRRHLHSTVCLAELAFGLGAAAPNASHAAQSRAALGDLFDRIEIRRTVSLPASGWMAAGLIAGVLARLQGGDRAARRRFLADAAIYLSARTSGTTLLTANWRDFDLIDQLAADGQAGARLLCYTPETSQAGGS